MEIINIARECADAFNKASGIGCTVTDNSDNNVAEFGYGIRSCELCSAMGHNKSRCDDAHAYGMNEAERFGGRYIYYCPMGLVCFVSPIQGELQAAARITAGPFFMVEREDYIDCEMDDLSNDCKKKAIEVAGKIPVVPPPRIEHLSKLLFMSASYMNNKLSLDMLNDRLQSRQIQEKIGGYIHQLKGEERASYPMEKEKALLKAVEKGDKPLAQDLLNQLLGHIMFSTGYDFEQIKARTYGLMVLIGRAATDAGADPEYALSVGDEGLRAISGFKNGEQLCLWLSKTVNSLMDKIFKYREAPHASIIRRCTEYIEKNYQEHITLESMAAVIYLSEAYLSRIFRKETGQSFTEYLNRMRIEQSKEMLRLKSNRIVDVAAAVGFEDQSYFTKVFKKHTGITPGHYRERIG